MSYSRDMFEEQLVTELLGLSQAGEDVAESDGVCGKRHLKLTRGVVGGSAAYCSER